MEEDIKIAAGIIAGILLIVFTSIGIYLLWDRHNWVKFLKEHHCHLSKKKDTAVNLSNWGGRRSSGSRKFRFPIYDYVCDDGKKYETSWFYQEEN
jgi:hypothetical protein